ncbi:unnamed protein product [Dibothriocephalus latus]|uniref:Uncharacterized protein n=1 Tax=Dibothriocephalus latus TaxID=60516 RepID=A0A3P6QTE3_DIBLA|nr:unnamed protein product [Dibothriocephalus latus]
MTMRPSFATPTLPSCCTWHRTRLWDTKFSLCRRSIETRARMLASPTASAQKFPFRQMGPALDVSPLTRPVDSFSSLGMHLYI